MSILENEKKTFHVSLLISIYDFMLLHKGYNNNKRDKGTKRTMKIFNGIGSNLHSETISRLVRLGIYSMLNSIAIFATNPNYNKTLH